MKKVYLLGAGPGDPGLLTVKAREILSVADVVVYDYLANSRFLDYCRKDAEIIYVGKKGGDHTLPQDEINALLVAKAGEGKTVARLKGGDPYVFGRGAEEAEELIDAGIACEVVPGVTSAVAAPAYAGIPLTHRKYASSVSFITGHEDPTKAESAHNWPALAAGTQTLVFFMGVKNLEDISANLINAGRSGQTPAALVRWGTTPNQRSVIGTLENIAALAREHRITAPALLIVGDVIKVRDKLNWFEQRPLFGKGVMVTRSRDQAGELSRLLEDKGAKVVEFPLIEIRPMSDRSDIRKEIGRLREYGWVVFTSVNGVGCFFAELKAMGLDARAFAASRVSAIGPATAAALRESGIEPDFVPDKYVAEHVLEGLLKLGAAKEKVLIPRARDAREVLPVRLAEAGAEVTVLPVYETVIATDRGDEALRMFADGEIDYVTFASSSTVDNFFSVISAERLSASAPGVKFACIGPITAETLRKKGFEPHIVPDEYTIPALVRALEADVSSN